MCPSMAPTEMCIGGDTLVTVPVSVRTDDSAGIRGVKWRAHVRAGAEVEFSPHVTHLKYRIGWVGWRNDDWIDKIIS